MKEQETETKQSFELKDDELLTQAKEHFKECEEVSNDNRRHALDDLEFARLGKQWHEKDQRNRELQGRPCLVINKLLQFIRQVVNDARQNKPQIKVHPVDDNADVETAKIINGLVRNIEAISRADIAYDTAIDYAASGGFGYIRIITDYACDDTFDQDLLIERVSNPFTVYEDPYSQSADGSDWNIAFITETLPKEKFKQLYPKAEITSWAADDKDNKDAVWFSSDNVRIAEYWRRFKVKEQVYKLSNGDVIKEKDFAQNVDLQGLVELGEIQIVDQREIESYKVMCYVITGAEVLERKEWAGRYIPIVPVYGDEINIEGKRVLQSLIHQAKDTQRNFNYWRSAATELVALAPKAPWVGPKGFAKGDANWETANTQNHSYLEYDGAVPPQRQPFAGMPAGALQEAMSAADDMKAIMGVYDASLGAKSNETSGRAIMARQREGDISTFHFIDNLNRSIRQVGAILIDLIPHIYSTERVIRVLGEDGTPETVAINKKVNVNGIEKIYDLTVGKYDLVVSSGPSFTTRREEAAYQMTELLRAFPQAAPVIGDLYAKNLDWPGAEEIAERLKSINPVLNKQNQGPSPEELKAQADLQMKQQELQQKQQQGQIDLQMKDKDLQMKNIELQIKLADAQVQREKNQAEITKSKMILASSINNNNNNNDQSNN